MSKTTKRLGPSQRIVLQWLAEIPWERMSQRRPAASVRDVALACYTRRAHPHPNRTPDPHSDEARSWARSILRALRKKGLVVMGPLLGRQAACTYRINDAGRAALGGGR